MSAAAMLRRLLAAWRRTHDPALEPAIARIGTELARARGPLTAPTKAALEVAWHQLAAARDVADVDRLLDARWPTSPRPALARIKALARFEPDPRIPIKLVTVVDAYRTTGYGTTGADPLHRAANKLLVRCPTETILPTLEALDDIYKGEYRRSVAAVMALKIRTADVALIAAAAPQDDVQPLVDALVRNPGDPEVRLVLADAWQAAGDPHGELIALQTAIANGSAGAGARGRVSALINTHLEEWTRHLPGILRCTFERGFLTGVQSDAFGPLLTASFDRPEWVTIEHLSIDGTRCEIDRLLRRMPLLRVFSSVWDQVLRHVINTGPYPSIRAFGGGFDLEIRNRAALPNLSVLAQRWRPLDWDVRYYRSVSQVAAELGLAAIVHVGFHLPSVGFAFAERHHGPPETRLTLGPSGPDPFNASGWRVRFRRDHDRVDLAWAGGDDHLRAACPQIIRQLADAGATEIALNVTPRMRQAIAPMAIALRALALLFDGGPIELHS